jgi:hypothetical protein
VPPRGKGLETLCQGVRNSEELMDVEGWMVVAFTKVLSTFTWRDWVKPQKDLRMAASLATFQIKCKPHSNFRGHFKMRVREKERGQSYFDRQRNLSNCFRFKSRCTMALQHSDIFGYTRNCRPLWRGYVLRTPMFENAGEMKQDEQQEAYGLSVQLRLDLHSWRGSGQLSLYVSGYRLSDKGSIPGRSRFLDPHNLVPGNRGLFLGR